MRTYLAKLISRIGYMNSISLAIQIILFVGLQPPAIQGTTQAVGPTRRVNVPYLQELPFEPAIFWFGQVDPSSNSADVRVYYYEEYLMVVVHIIDRLHWSDPFKNAADLTNWDAISLYLDLDGNDGFAPGTNSYRLDAQLDGLKAGSQGDGSTWQSDPSAAYSIETSWRGDQGPNSGVDGKGWQVKYSIPFSSLGLTSPPANGTIWGFSLILHDRDDSLGSNIRHTTWPEFMDPMTPGSWGQLVFRIPGYQSPKATPQGEIMIRQGLNGAKVMDGHVGGHTTCGADVDHWSEWGEANYAGFTQINIQNQWDISDWPCFSKYYITIPLDSLPPGKVIIDASLTMVLFGNAGGGDWGEPPDSYIQVFTVAEDWTEATLNWNNAPMALENISGTWVYPRDYDLPDQPYHWDVSKAVHEAYVSGEPLRLALYSADGERHTGKYFWSSDVGDWNANARPTLRVTIGDSSVPPQPNNHIFTYLPQVLSSNH